MKRRKPENPYVDERGVPRRALGLDEERAFEEDEPDPQKEKRVVFEEPGSAMRLAEGGAGEKIPPPEK